MDDELTTSIFSDYINQGIANQLDRPRLNYGDDLISGIYRDYVEQPGFGETSRSARTNQFGEIEIGGDIEASDVSNEADKVLSPFAGVVADVLPGSAQVRSYERLGDLADERDTLEDRPIRYGLNLAETALEGAGFAADIMPGLKALGIAGAALVPMMARRTKSLSGLATAPQANRMTGTIGSKGGESLSAGDDVVRDSMRITTPSGRKIRVTQNPDQNEMYGLIQEVKANYPDAPKGSVYLRSTQDESGNKYYWDAMEAMHSDVEPSLGKMIGKQVDQNGYFDLPTDTVGRAKQ